MKSPGSKAIMKPRTPVMSRAEIAKEGIKLANQVFDEYKNRRRFDEEIIRRQSIHKIRMDGCEKISEYRRENLDNLSETEKVQLTSTFCDVLIKGQ